MEGVHSLAQVQSQSLLMTAELQQSLKLLQSGKVELQEMIERELQENPVLEIVEDSDEERKGSEDNEPICDSWAEPSYSAHRSHDNEGYSIEEQFAGRGTSLVEHLLVELLELDLTLREREITSYIVGNLNGDGYLAASCAEMADTLESTIPEVEEMLTIVQSLEPIGVGARDLKECLMLQLANLGLQDELEGKLLTVYFRELEMGRFQQIVEQEGIAVSAFHKAMANLRRLDPSPGRKFPSEQTIYIVADVMIQKVGKQYVASLNSGGIPEIRVNSQYEELLKKKKEFPKNERQFLRGKLKAASWFMHCLTQRDETLSRVANAIVWRQQEFFEKGPEKVKPLSLSELSEELDLHESTISRAMANKYMQTPRGLIPFKYFLSPRIKTEVGLIATSSIKEQIRKLISEEWPQSPITDQEIVRVLKQTDIVIARRTVGKYREAMGIESATIRKQRNEITRYAA